MEKTVDAWDLKPWDWKTVHVTQANGELYVRTGQADDMIIKNIHIHPTDELDEDTLVQQEWALTLRKEGKGISEIAAQTGLLERQVCALLVSAAAPIEMVRRYKQREQASWYEQAGFAPPGG